MKIHFPHGEHKDVSLAEGVTTLGSSAEADINLQATGIAAKHVTFTSKDGEVHVSIDNPACLVSVNGKLVKTNREVRDGDLVIISQTHCKIVSGESKQDDSNQTRIRMALPKYILRGVSGSYFGKTFPLRGVTTLGRHSDCDICVNDEGISRKHAHIAVDADGITIKDLGSSNGTFVNGNKVSEHSLEVGDEVRLDNIRFLIQTPGMPQDQHDTKQAPARAAARKPAASSTAEQADQGTSGGGAGKWLVTLLVLLVAGGAAAYYMGWLDQFIK